MKVRCFVRAGCRVHGVDHGCGHGGVLVHGFDLVALLLFLLLLLMFDLVALLLFLLLLLLFTCCWRFVLLVDVR
jgi:hypothetical protein